MNRYVNLVAFLLFLWFEMIDLCFLVTPLGTRKVCELSSLPSVHYFRFSLTSFRSHFPTCYKKKENDLRYGRKANGKSKHGGIKIIKLNKKREEIRH